MDVIDGIVAPLIQDHMSVGIWASTHIVQIEIVYSLKSVKWITAKNSKFFLPSSIIIFMRVITIILLLPVALLLNQTQIASALFENLFGPEPPCLSKRDIVSKSGFSVYDNKQHKVQIQYPSGWIKEEDNGKYTSGDSTLYSLATFQPDTADGFKTTLELEINDISKYPGHLKSLEALAEFEEEYVTTLPENSIVSSREIQINTCPAYEIVYLEPISGKQDVWKSALTFLIDCNKQYVLRYTGTDSQLYDQYLNDIGDMIETFHVANC